MALPPSNASRELAGYAGKCLDRIYRWEHQNKKAGVLLFDLCKREKAQPMMFDDRDVERANHLMVTIDKINRDFGRGTRRIASSSALSLNAGRTWHLRSDHRSPRYTTRWGELPLAIAREREFAR